MGKNTMGNMKTSKCWYSPVLSRETTGGSDRSLDWFGGRFHSPEQAVDFLVDPERGLGVCSEDGLERAFAVAGER